MNWEKSQILRAPLFHREKDVREKCDLNQGLKSLCVGWETKYPWLTPCAYKDKKLVTLKISTEDIQPMRNI